MHNQPISRGKKIMSLRNWSGQTYRKHLAILQLGLDIWFRKYDSLFGVPFCWKFLWNFFARKINFLWWFDDCNNSLPFFLPNLQNNFSLFFLNFFNWTSTQIKLVLLSSKFLPQKWCVYRFESNFTLKRMHLKITPM